MSQISVYGLDGSKQITGIPVDEFATLLLTTNVASTFTVGELITGGTSGATAKVSGVVANNTLRIKAVKGVGSMTAFSDGETITGNKSTSTATTGTSAFVIQKKATRVAATVANTGTAVYTFDTVSLTDEGLKQTHRDSQVETKNALRLELSKSQNTDASVTPTTSWTMPAAQTYSIAAGTLMRFTLTSNEAITVVGAPRIAILDFGSAHTVYATYNRSASSSYTMVFDYTTEATAATGQIVSATYQANGATVRDAGTSTTLTPAAMGSVTGIVIGA